jgi:hypothetical protein
MGWPIPDWALDEMNGMEARLAGLGHDFDLWTAWYRRHLVGGAAAFGLPPEGEEEIAHRLVQADNGWWEKPATVNRDIKAWIAELEPPPQSAEVDEQLFNQNPRTMAFDLVDDDQFSLSATGLGEHVRQDAGA